VKTVNTEAKGEHDEENKQNMKRKIAKEGQNV
jgi:hypothetical protein